MTLLFAAAGEDPDPWRRALAPLLPERDLAGAGWRVWPDLGDPAAVRDALVWKPPAGSLAGLPNLRAILNLGAGVDALAADETLPGVPVVRLIDPAMTAGMSEYVLYWVLHFHRHFHLYAERARAGKWGFVPQVDATERRVGILGLGELGGDAARKLAALDFDVAGWSRRPKTIDGVTSFHGGGGLDDLLARSDILVNLLPLTAATADILRAATLARLPQGACVINAARGAHLVEDDLLAALDSGHIAAAALDVFRAEPLPAGHPFWTHPRVFVTPHVASQTMVPTAAAVIADNIRRLDRGETPTGLVDRGSWT
ncbi:MAG: glyoxylate/hydroxypyruvate reductase A [Hyphomicrobiales bacterium]|nr:glyoxylate/hydroxypyruvate reductase A [Hyphomicrobiales bacterium]MCP5374168.1 glyoxylate/hydroxypyruvate reductase A [Hyphomicrobiales bacterium]